MKKVFIIALTLFSLVVNAQERTSRKSNRIFSFEESSGIMTSATGWKYNPTTDSWVNNPNVILDEKYTKESVLIKKMASTDLGFISIQTKRFGYLYVMIVERWNKIGSPTNEPYKEKVGYVFYITDYYKFANNELSRKPYTVCPAVKVSHREIDGAYNESVFIQNIINAFNLLAEFIWQISSQRVGHVGSLCVVCLSTHSQARLLSRVRMPMCWLEGFVVSYVHAEPPHAACRCGWWFQLVGSVRN